MATLAIQTIGITGLNPVFVAADVAGDRVTPGQGSYFEVVNGGASPITVTIVTPESVDGDLAVADRAVSVTNGQRRKIAIPARYASPSDGLASITYSAVTSVTVGSFRGPVS